MSMTRRELMKRLGALGALGAAGGWSGLAQAARRERLIPWKNWSGGQQYLPAARLAPDSEAALEETIRGATGIVRPVGASHSISALVPTDGTIVSLGNLSGLISHDAAKLQAEFWAGTPMSQIGEPLQKIGQVLPNMSDSDYQT
ncbi:MAG: FAD-binding protein, partial [Solimonas sp.]